MSGREARCEKPAPVDPADADSHPVVLVHGWNGTSESLQPIARSIGNAFGKRLQVFYFDYAQYGDHWAGTPLVSDCLAVFITDVVSQWKNEPRRVFMVVHSMGGLAARYASALTVRGQSVGTRIAGLITLDTPHRGSVWGGTIYARIIAELRKVKGSVLPDPNTDAARCLALHSGGSAFPKDCGDVPPYLNSSAALLQIAGEVSVQRRTLGKVQYTINFKGDSIVGTPSQLGYKDSGPAQAEATGLIMPSVTVKCLTSVDILLIEALKLDRSWAEMVAAAGQRFDSAAVDDIQNGKASLSLAALVILANETASCSHSLIIKDEAAKNAVNKALGAWLDALSPCLSPNDFAKTAGPLFMATTPLGRNGFATMSLFGSVTCEAGWATAGGTVMDTEGMGTSGFHLLRRGNNGWVLVGSISTAGRHSSYTASGFKCSSLPSKVFKAFGNGCTAGSQGGS